MATIYGMTNAASPRSATGPDVKDIQITATCKHDAGRGDGAGQYADAPCSRRGARGADAPPRDGDSGPCGDDQPSTLCKCCAAFSAGDSGRGTGAVSASSHGPPCDGHALCVDARAWRDDGRGGGGDLGAPFHARRCRPSDASAGRKERAERAAAEALALAGEAGAVRGSTGPARASAARARFAEGQASAGQRSSAAPRSAMRKARTRGRHKRGGCAALLVSRLRPAIAGGEAVAG